MYDPVNESRQLQQEQDIAELKEKLECAVNFIKENGLLLSTLSLHDTPSL